METVLLDTTSLLYSTLLYEHLTICKSSETIALKLDRFDILFLS